MKQRTSNTRCAKCELEFTTWDLYRAHNAHCRVIIEPLNTSGRSKDQIVDAYEIWLGQRLIDGNIGPQIASLGLSTLHLEDCRCWQCQALYLAKMNNPEATKIVVLDDNKFEIERF